MADDVPELADAVAAAALGCPAVARLADDEGLATYLPGRRVAGVSVSGDRCEVAVVVRPGDRPLPEVADEVRAAVADVVGNRAVDVYIADLADPQELEAGSGDGPT